MTITSSIPALIRVLIRIAIYFFFLAASDSVRAQSLRPGPPRVPPNTRAKVEFAHPPYTQGLCGVCHITDDLKDPGPVKSAQTNICFTCHLDLLNTLSMQRSRHKPVEKSCQYCHNPHTSSRTHLLIADPLNLCTSCHKPIRKILTKSKVQHGAITLKQSCTNCHDPHGGDFEYRLRSKPYDLCVQCHSVDGLLDHNGKKMINFRKLIDENPNRHAPVADKECSACHQPHGANVERLLIDPYPATFYMPYHKERYALCYECHVSDIIDIRDTRRTGFRNGNNNLHFIHVVLQKKGRSCRACHAVHASKQAFHIRESVPYGTSGWELQLNFSQKAGGGSCKKTCHETREYRRGDERLSPVSRIQNRTMRTVSGRQTTLLNRKGITVLLFLRPNQSQSRFILQKLKTCFVYLENKPVYFVGVVPDQFPASSIRQMLAAVGLQLPMLIDADFTLEIELGVKAYPQFQIVDRDGVVMTEMFISKSNTCLPLVERIRYALGEMSYSELTALLNPPSVVEEREEALVDRYVGLATVLLRNRKYAEAKVAVDLALKRDPASATAQAVMRAISTTQGDRPELEAIRAERQIKIDGELTEFKESRPLHIRAGNATAAFRIQWNDDALHCAAHVEDKDLWIQGSGRDGDLRRADGIEILLDPLLDRSERSDVNERQVVVNCAGELYEARGVGKGKNRRYDTKMKSAVVLHGTIGDMHADKGYDVELSIPWKVLGVAPGNGKRIGVNLVLNNANEEEVFSAGWAGIAGYDIPSYWNDLVLVDSSVDTERSPKQSASNTRIAKNTRDKAPTENNDVKNRSTGCGCRTSDCSRLSRSTFFTSFAIVLCVLGRLRRWYRDL